jgi:hypothetical protein
MTALDITEDILISLSLWTCLDPEQGLLGAMKTISYIMSRFICVALADIEISMISGHIDI